LYIDVGDWKSPVSFDKAVEVYGSLPALLGSRGEQAVPLKVWLYPLKKLDKSSGCAALSRVSESMIQRVENVQDHLRKQIRMCQDMLTDYINVKVITWFSGLKDKLIEFSELLWEYQMTLQKEIAKVNVNDIKDGKGDKHLLDLLERHGQSPFSAEKTNQWLENKETELKILNDFKAAEIAVVKSQAELQQIISHPQKNVMCFNISSQDFEDYFLTTLRQHIESYAMPCDSLISKPVIIDQKVLIDVQLFIANKETNEDPEQTNFIAASIPDDGFREYSVWCYYDGRIVSNTVDLRAKPNLAQIDHRKHTSVTIKLDQTLTKNKKYVVEYRALTDDGMIKSSWKQIIFDAKETCMISNLKSGHRYQLRYSVIEKDFMSNFSKIMNFQTAVAATPGQPLVNKVNRDTFQLAWLKAEANEDCPVLQYRIEYKEAGLEGWSSVLTQGTECECTLTVPCTFYRVRVSAVYEDITSKPSEETPVPVD
ncbi:hypothetical protein M9458_031302, partial [Cirrhinus mrigala]